MLKQTEEWVLGEDIYSEQLSYFLYGDTNIAIVGVVASWKKEAN